MMYYTFLYGLLINIFLVIFSVTAMERSQKSSERLLIQLQEDARKENFIYKPNYFNSIAKKINDEYINIEKDPSRFFLLDDYEKQLDFHAHKYIHQLTQNPLYSVEQRKEQLKNYFSEEDPALMQYLYEGLQKINAQEAKKAPLVKLEKPITAQVQSVVLYEKLQEEEKKNLFQEIMRYKPELRREENRPELRREEKLDFGIYTPEYLRDLRDEEQKEKSAIIYIKYAVNNEDWPTIEEKLAKIESFLGKDTKFYLLKTLDSILVMTISKRQREKEELPEVGTAEEINEEEIEENQKVRVPEQIIEENRIEPYIKEQKRQLDAKVKPEQLLQKQPSQPIQQPEIPTTTNIFYRAATFVFEGIKSFFSSIFNFIFPRPS